MEPEAESVGRVTAPGSNSQGRSKRSDFQKEPPWTLLVQRVDHWFSEVAALKSILPALPNGGLMT